MVDPLFWLGLSILLVAVSLTAVLVVALPALQELSRAARSAEKLFDTLNRELPPTLEAIRLTGIEISELTDGMSEGVQSAEKLAKQVEQSLNSTRQQVHKAQTTTRSLFVGVKAAWKTFTRKSALKRRHRERHLPAGGHLPLELERQTSSYPIKHPPKSWEDRSQQRISEFSSQSQDHRTSHGENGQSTDSWEELGGNSSQSTSSADQRESDSASRLTPDRIISPSD